VGGAFSKGHTNLVTLQQGVLTHEDEYDKSSLSFEQKGEE